MFAFLVVVSVGISLSVAVLGVVGVVEIIWLVDVVSVPVLIVLDIVGAVVEAVDICGVVAVVVVEISAVVVLLGRVHMKYFCAANPSYILQPNPHDATETGLFPVGL